MAVYKHTIPVWDSCPKISKNQTSKFRDCSLAVQGAKLFNSMPKTSETFQKKRLDFYKATKKLGKKVTEKQS